MPAQRRDDDLADGAGRRRLAAPRRYDFDKYIRVHLQARRERAVGAIGLVGDHAEFGARIGLPRADAASLQLGAQARRQRRAGNERLAQRGRVDAGGFGLVEQDLEIIRRPAIAVRPSCAIACKVCSALPGPAGIVAQPSACAPLSMMKPPGVR